MSTPPPGPPDPYRQGPPPGYPPVPPPNGPPPPGPPPNGPPPPGPPYCGRPPRKKGKGWIWLLSGGAFLLVVLVVGMFIGLNILSKNSQMSRDVVALNDRSSGNGPTHDSPSAEPSESPSEERSESPSEEPSESPSPEQNRSNEADDGGQYETGQCINAHSSLVVEVDCDEKHLAQIFYTEQLPNDEYPEKARFKSAAKRICPEHVKDAIDSGTVTKEFAVSYLRPTRSDWDEGDHNVYCLVARKDGKHFAGTKLLTQ